MSAWVCPVCNRGVAPDVKYCDHGGVSSLPRLPDYPAGTGAPPPDFWSSVSGSTVQTHVLGATPQSWTSQTQTGDV
jgi:hypothetical protein